LLERADARRDPQTESVAGDGRPGSELGYENVIDLSSESLAEGVERILGGKGVDAVIDAIGGSSPARPSRHLPQAAFSSLLAIRPAGRR